jgi:hypothetical protein
MKTRFEISSNDKQQQGGEEFSPDQDFGLALAEFKNSVHAWSDAAYHRPRQLSREVRTWSWKLAFGWALGCALVVGSVGGGLVERHHLNENARMQTLQHEAELQRQLRAEQAAKVSDEVLLADVDSDVSRQVPSALEPLAQMMGDDETR